MNDLALDILTVVPEVTNRIEEGTEDKSGHPGKTNQETPEEARALATELGGGLTRERPGLAMNDLLPDLLTMVTEVTNRIEEETENKTRLVAMTNQEIPEEVLNLLATDLGLNHVTEPPDQAMSDLLPDFLTVIARVPVVALIEKETETPTGHPAMTNRETPEEAHDLLPTSLSGNHVKKHPRHLITDPHLRVLTTLDPRKKHKKLRVGHSLKNEAKRNVEAKNTIRKNS